MRFSQRKAVFIDVVAVCTLDFSNLMAASGNKTDHVDPEDILHTAAGYCAVVSFCDCIKAVRLHRSRRPGINCLFARCNNIDTARDAFFNVSVNIVYKTEQSNDRNISVALVKNLIGFVGDYNACLDAQAGKIADILPHYRGVNVNRTDYLCAVLMQVAKNVLAHFSAAVLYNFNFFHRNFLLYCNYYFGGYTASCNYSINPLLS